MIRRSIFVSFLDRYSNLAIQILAVVILSRLLTPREVGVYSVGAAIVALAHTLRDFGVAQYIVQERDLTRDKLATAFGVMLLTSWTVAAAMFLSRDAVAGWYGEPGLRAVILLLAANFLVIPFTAPALAVLTREMRFGALYRINVFSSLTNSAVAVALAYAGFGYMSLAWASLAGVLASVAATALLRPSESWVRPSLTRWREVARFGGYASVTSLLVHVGLWAPEVILGRTLGFAAAGFFSKGKGFISMLDDLFARALSPVLLADFSKADRAGQSVKPRYLHTLTLTTVIGWPLALASFVLAGPAVHVVFGDQWTRSVPVVQILAAAMAVRLLTQFAASPLVAVGRVDLTMRLALIGQPIRVALVAAGAFHSLEAVALALGAANVVQFGLTQRAMHQVFGLTLAETAAATARSLAVTALCAVPLGLLHLLPGVPDSAWLTLALAALLGPATWLGGLFLFGHKLKDELLILVANLRGRLRARRPAWPGQAGAE